MISKPCTARSGNLPRLFWSRKAPFRPKATGPDFGLTRDMAETYAPMTITVSYTGQDGTPKPFLMIINWIKVGKDWKVASEIILPVPPAPAAKG